MPPRSEISVQSPAEFGTLLRERRRTLGLSQSEIANVVGVNRRVVGQLENGKDTVQLRIALELARVVGLDIRASPRS